MKIPYINLGKQNNKIETDLKKIFINVVSKGDYVGGKSIEKFERNIAKFCGTRYAIALNSGTDALTLALYCSGVKKNDEVITTPNSFIASTSTIVHLGAKPVFVDVNNDQNMDVNKIEDKITKKTKCIMPVHLTGRMCDMKKINLIAKKYNLVVIEDAAQSVGSKFKNKKSGSYGQFGCFSAHPLKNLNAIGDSGYLTTNNYKYYKKIKLLSNHGIYNRNIVKYFGHVSRMDVLQAEILNYKLKNINKVIKKRRNNFKLYSKYLNKQKIYFPLEKKDEFNTYHTFVIQIENRNKLQKYLKVKGVDTTIHYPIPIHLQPASKNLNYNKGDYPVTEKQAKKILTLPIHQDLKKNEIKYICKLINNFYK